VLGAIGLWMIPLHAWTINYADAFETPHPGIIENDRGWFIWKEFDVNGLKIWAIQLIQPKPAQAQELPLGEQIEAWISVQATKHRLNAKILGDLGNCESGWRTDPYKAIKAQGDFRSETGEYLANGLFQWHWRSWMKYSIIYPQKIWDYESWKDQTELSALVLKDGGWKNWYNCYRWITK